LQLVQGELEIETTAVHNWLILYSNFSKVKFHWSKEELQEEVESERQELRFT